MQREIKFRGKRVDDGRWVYGYYIYMGVTRRYADMEFAHMILDSSSKDAEGLIQNEVIPETVGQYTGLKDKNGKEIYEGDIVVRSSNVYTIEYWSNQLLVGWYIKDISCGDTEYLDCFGNLEVIGNIYSNPELLESEE